MRKMFKPLLRKVPGNQCQVITFLPQTCTQVENHDLIQAVASREVVVSYKQRGSCLSTRSPLDMHVGSGYVETSPLPTPSFGASGIMQDMIT
jgi:hypothetical protein